MRSNFINIALKAAYSAGKEIQKSMSKLSSIEISKKGYNDFVTEVDKKSESIIINTISTMYPSHNFLGEEGGLVNNNSEFTWIIDPIDGTTNFIHGNPHYCISIALKKLNKVILGIILDPNRNDIYTAEAGSGAYVNEKRMRVSKINNLENALIMSGSFLHMASTLNESANAYLKIIEELLIKTGGIRRSGSAALDLAYVAAGYVDCFWESNLKQWDFAAGSILVKEAGGIITDFNNTDKFWDSGNIIACNSKLLPQMLKIINKYIQ